MVDLFDSPTTARTIKALSLWQPWASLMAAGLKIDETRHWTTEHRGPVAIHAAKTRDLAGAPEALCQAAFGPFWSEDLPLGCVVAVGRLVSCRRAEAVADHLTRANLAAGNFTPGRYAWRFADIRPVRRPIPLVGRQGLFNWAAPADLEDHLGLAVDHAAACRLLGWGA